MTDTPIDEQYIADAVKARSQPVYVCFQEPSDPLAWTMRDPDDPAWGGTAETLEQYRARLTCTTEVLERNRTGACPETHSALGCGWYWLIPAPLDTSPPLRFEHLERVLPDAHFEVADQAIGEIVIYSDLSFDPDDPDRQALERLGA